jgi:hypothetical protein
MKTTWSQKNFLSEMVGQEILGHDDSDDAVPQSSTQEVNFHFHAPSVTGLIFSLISKHQQKEKKTDSLDIQCGLISQRG